MKQTAVEWLIEQIFKYRLVPEGTNADNVLFHKAKAMEKEQNEFILNYIKEVRDLCDKLRFPTEEELRELTIKADNILLTFKSE